MGLRLCTYNIEHFDACFTSTNQLSKAEKNERQLEAVRDVLNHIDPDILGIVEAPNTATTGTKRTIDCLEVFAEWAGLRTNKAMMGFISRGRQELAILVDPDKVTLEHIPGGRVGNRRNPTFEDEFIFDSDDDRVHELYQHYRPPLEARITRHDGGEDIYLLLVHLKSKGIFTKNDWLHWQRETERNRRKLFAEATSVRQRVDEWLDLDRRVVVMGDINDGPGMDIHEFKFGRSAIEIVMGDVFEPHRILNNHGGKPIWGRYGWEPSSTRFKDSFTGDPVNALIDHILVSQAIAINGTDAYKIWNPFHLQEAKSVRTALMNASDHYPISLDIV